MKKIIALSLVVMLLVTAFTGCGKAIEKKDPIQGVWSNSDFGETMIQTIDDKEIVTSMNNENVAALTYKVVSKTENDGETVYQIEITDEDLKYDSTVTVKGNKMTYENLEYTKQ